MIKPFAASVLLAASLATQVAAAPATMTLDDIPRIAQVSNVAIAPDGTQIAFIVTRENMKDDTNDSTLELYDLATKRTRALSYDRKGLASPAWSPNGERLAFLALDGKGDDAHQQLYVMDMRGGDAVPVTDAPARRARIRMASGWRGDRFFRAGCSANEAL